MPNLRDFAFKALVGASASQVTAAMSPSCPWWAAGAWGEVRKRGTAHNLRLGFNPSPFGEEQHAQGGMLRLRFGIGERAGDGEACSECGRESEPCG